MQICGINASPRGAESNTRLLVEAVLDGAREAGADTRYIDLCEYDIDYCTGCTVCYATGECVQDDDLALVYDQMLASDGIVFGSPTYINSVTAQMKTYLDRLADAIHCQMLEGKYGCAVSTAGGSGADEVAGYLSRLLVTFGATSVGTVGAVMEDGDEAFAGAVGDARRMGTSLADAIRTRLTDPDQEAIHREMRERMMDLVSKHRDEWPHQYEHWASKEGT